MEKLIKDFLKQKRFAVVGSFKNETKYAHKILKDLLKKGYEVYPVNPCAREVYGIKCYKSVNDIPFDIDVVNVVTGPSVSESVIKQCREKLVKRVWLQPGAESEKVINLCQYNDIKVIHGLCVMLGALQRR